MSADKIKKYIISPESQKFILDKPDFKKYLDILELKTLFLINRLNERGIKIYYKCINLYLTDFNNVPYLLIKIENWDNKQTLFLELDKDGFLISSYCKAKKENYNRFQFNKISKEKMCEQLSKIDIVANQYMRKFNTML